MNKSLDGLMKKAQEMQKKMQEIQQQVAEMKVTGKSGGGLVEVTMNGQHYVERVTLDPSLMQEEITVIADLMAAAFNDATDKIEKGTRGKMSVLGGIKLPDGFDLPLA